MTPPRRRSTACSRRNAARSRSSSSPSGGISRPRRPPPPVAHRCPTLRREPQHERQQPGSEPVVRLLIVADNLLAAESIRRELRHAPAFAVLGYVDGRQPCAATVAEAAPDVV